MTEQNAPNPYTLRRLLKAYVGALIAGTIATVVLLVLLFVLAYYAWVLSPGPRAAPFQEQVDGVLTPPGWEVADTSVKETGYIGGCARFLDPYCPSVRRYYRVDAPVADVYRSGRRALTDAGGVLEEGHDSECTTASGSMCWVAAYIGDSRLDLTVFAPGKGDESGMERPGRVLVRLTVRYDPRPTSAPAADAERVPRGS